MSRARNIADLLDANGDVKATGLDNVPPSNDASALTTGTLPIARIADGAITAGKLSQTYLTPTGDGSGLSGIASDKLTSEFNLDTGVTLGAGKLASVKSDGTLAAYPELTAVSGGQDSGSLYGNGTRFVTDITGTTGVSWTWSSGQPTSTFYVTGHVVSTTSSWTSGTEFTKTWTFGGTADNTKSDNINCYPHPTRNNSFIVAWSRDNTSGASGTPTVGWRYFIIDVSPSTGNITEASSGISTTTTMSMDCSSCRSHQALVFCDSDGSNIWLYAWGNWRSAYPVYSYAYYTATLSGTTFSSFVSEGTTTSASDLTFGTTLGNFPSNELGSNGGNRIGRSAVNVSTGGYVTWIHNGTTARKATWSGSAGGLASVTGSYTEQNLATLFADGNYANTWEIFTFIDGDTFVGVYNSTDSKLSILTASIDSSGDLTYVDSTVLFSTGAGSVCDINAKSDTEIVVTFRYLGNTYVIPVGLNADRTLNTPASAVIVGTNAAYYDLVVHQTSTADNYLVLLRNDALDGVELYEIDVPYYSETKPFQYIGVSETSQSSSPASVVTHGVAGGFTGLTVGSVYYASSDLDGTVTTSTSSGIRIGRAVSTTEILVGEFD